MTKDYIKFHSIGNNDYYTLIADNEMFIATSTYIGVEKRLFKKKIVQGLKLLKITPPMMVLFDFLTNITKLEGQEDVPKEFIKYNITGHDKVKDYVKETYKEALKSQLDDVDIWLEKMYEETSKRLKRDNNLSEETLKEKTAAYRKRARELKQRARENDPIKTNRIDVRQPTKNKVLSGMMHSNIHHLYTEPITGFMSNVYMYNVDEFGKVIIYRVITVKNVVQTIDTFIYDIAIVKKLEKHLEKSNRKRGK